MAGNGVRGFAGDGGPARRARLSWPVAVAFDHAGNILVSEFADELTPRLLEPRVQVIAASTAVLYGRHMTTGHIYTLAIAFASGLATDSSGNVIVTGLGSSVQVVAAKTGTFYGQPMTAGKVYTLQPVQTGTNTMFPTTAAVDHHGNIVIGSAERGTFATVQVIAVKTGTFYGVRMKADRYYTVAGGTFNLGRTGNGIPAVTAHLGGIGGVAVARS